MSDVQFQDQQPRYQYKKKQSFLMRLVFATGLAKNEQQAQYILLGVAVLALVIGAFLLFGVGRTPSSTQQEFLPGQSALVQ